MRAKLWTSLACAVALFGFGCSDDTTNTGNGRDGGSFTSVRGYQGDGQRGIDFTTTFVRDYEGEFEKLDTLRQLADSGAITLRVAQTFAPEQAPDAHRRLEAGGIRGRLVIQFS